MLRSRGNVGSGELFSNNNNNKKNTWWIPES
jgi:hypothetical protein